MENSAASRRLVVSGFISTFVEWYDFLIYGIIAALVFDQAFFPDFSPAAGTLASLSTFAIGFAARPVGAVVFGHFGDRLGRRKVLIITLMLMGGATTAIGLLPTYSSIGIWAPILLIVLRLLQGISVGGEWGGVAMLLVESAPTERRGRVGSWAQLGGYLGPLAGTLVVLGLAMSMSDEQFQAWGWRIPFLVSVLLVAVGMYIRLHIEESPVFEHEVEAREPEENRSPLAEVLRERKKPFFAVAIIHGGETAALFLGITFIPSFMKGEGHFSNTAASMAVAVFLVAASITVMLSGVWSDRVGRKIPVIVGSALEIVGIYPILLAATTGSWTLTIVSMILVGAGAGLVYGVEPAYFAELFPTRYRYTGVSVAVQIGVVVAGATAPIIATAMLVTYDLPLWTLGLYVAAWCAASMAGAAAVGNPAGKSLIDDETRPDDVAPLATV